MHFDPLMLRRGGTFLFPLIFAVILTCAMPARAATELPKNFDPKRYIAVDEVEPGMTGYGMTVFHGATPEPFRVEVISVERGFFPGKSVVWVRCPDDRMQLTGPVQGMSGSPIYLWNKGDEKKPGEGGRMLGAFAFGYRLGKDCYVGIQPIQQMLAAGNRAKSDTSDRKKTVGSGAARDQMLAASFQLADQLGLKDEETWRLKALADLVHFKRAPGNAGSLGGASGESMVRANQLSLPVTVGSAEMATLLQPYFAPMGLAAQARPNPTSPLPPKWIDPAKVKMEPGGVFAIPLVMGPLDMSAVGTVTEVLPDGTALAFGHQFFAEGDIAVPMATGYVHFVQPNISASFEIGGAARIIGAVTRDEQVAVVGKPEAKYPSVPVNVKIKWPEQSLNQTYEYTIVHHERLLPALLAATVGSSLTSDTTLPRINTLNVRSTIRFKDGKQLNINRLVPNGSTGQIALAMVPALSALMDNEFGEMDVQSIDASVGVAEEVRGATIVAATLEESTVKPGDWVVAYVRVKPYRGEDQIKKVAVQVPTDVPDGQYTLTIGGAQSYLQQKIISRPHLMNVDNMEELFKAVEMQLDIKDDAIYTVLSLHPANNLAIGRSELPHLPSSRLALMAVDTSTRTSPYVESAESIDDMPWVIMGTTSLPVNVKKEPERK